MWVMLSDCFFSIVNKDCARDEVLVRARRPGDIEKVWPSARVTRQTSTDYLFRARIKRAEVSAALDSEVRRVTYDNFKDSVEDVALHNAYLRVWSAMAEIQTPRPYAIGLGPAKKPAKKRRKR